VKIAISWRTRLLHRVLTVNDTTPLAFDRATFDGEELLFIAASRLIENSDVVVVGSGIAFVVAMLAQRLHAPEVGLVVDSGAVDPVLKTIPQSVSEARVAHRSLQRGSMREVLGSLLHRCRVVALLGAAEVDRFGNLNSSYVRKPDGRTTRLVGSGGATAMLACAGKIIIPMRHEARRFPERCQYVSSPGYLGGGSMRRTRGLHEPNPELIVVTDLCVMRAAGESGELVVAALMPGRTLREVEEHTGFHPRTSPTLCEVRPPSAEELRVLRREVDPCRRFLRGLVGGEAKHGGLNEVR
jgi:glutaconate CoA-transferase, subunit B